MAQPRKKIIHKRVKKRERFAFLARKRHRKYNKNVSSAQVEDVEKLKDTTNDIKIHHFSSCLIITEKNNRICFDATMLNKEYITNDCIVSREGEKLLCIQLHRKISRQEFSDEEILAEWESRGDPYWNEWSQKIRNFNNLSKSFREINDKKFRTDKLDAESLNIYNNYLALRKQISSNNPCIEFKMRFDSENIYCSELVFNSKSISIFNYEFDEFRDIVLRGGIPKLKYSRDKEELNFHLFVDNFEDIFKKSIQYPAIEGHFITKDNKIKRVIMTICISGYFYKRAAEVSFISSFETIEETDIPVIIPKEEPSEQTIDNKEEQRRMFLEKFYPNEELKFEQNEDEEASSCDELGDIKHEDDDNGCKNEDGVANAPSLEAEYKASAERFQELYSLYSQQLDPNNLLGQAYMPKYI